MGNDRYILRLGTYDDWFADDANFALTLASGRDALAPLLISSDEAYRRYDERSL